MKIRTFCQVDLVIQIIIREARLKKTDGLLERLPEDLRQIIISNQNINYVIARINAIRDVLENELAQMSSFKVDWRRKPAEEKRFRKLLASPAEGLLSAQQDLVKKIKFLFVLAKSIRQLESVKVRA